MSEQRCSAKVWRGFQYYSCSAKAKHFVDCAWYCGTHNPEAVKRREEKQAQKYAERQKASTERWNEQKRIDALLTVLKDHGITTAEQLREILEKVKA